MNSANIGSPTGDEFTPSAACFRDSIAARGKKQQENINTRENHESLVSTYSNVGGSVKSFPTKDKTRKTVFHKLKQLDNEFPFCQ